VLAQLQRLFRGKGKWEVLEFGHEAFVAKFPTKIELQRALAFGGADVKGEGVPSGVRLIFDVWQEKKEGFSPKGLGESEGFAGGAERVPGALGCGFTCGIHTNSGYGDDAEK
jgi:hypothetical protein